MPTYYGTSGGALAMNKPSSASSAPPQTSHSVSRSSELLSCARTSLKLFQSQPPTPQTEWLMAITAQQLQLYPETTAAHTELQTLLEDGLSLLREMEKALDQLQSLVRRRGHTNDPTKEIARVMRQFETDAKELAEMVPTITATAPRTSSQVHKHLSLIATWLQAVAAQQTSRMKELLQLRASVLADQAQRRKRLQPQSQPNASTTATSSTGSGPRRAASTARNGGAQWDSPLFTATNMPQSVHQNGNGVVSSGSNTGVAPAPAARTVAPAMTSSGATSNPYYSRSGSAGYNGYGGGYGGATAGYGGGYGGDVGMRQRRPASGTSGTSDGSHDAVAVQAQIQERQQQRQSQSRLDSARQAEQTLSNLTSLFGKMSSLIVQQGEVIDKVEDDVEAALCDVTAGQEEVTKLYGLKKGNRMLIIKVFAVLIFFILFMRLY